MQFVTIYEDWNERDGKVYYRWRLSSEKQWHEKLTAYKEKPTGHVRYVSEIEFGEFKKKFEGSKDQ